MSKPRTTQIKDVTATAAELNILDGATLTTTELNYVDGVTSSIQTQLNAKLTNIVEDLTPELGGELDANGQNIIDLADITFKTGATGGTMRTGTSNADKFELQAYDVNGGFYQKVLEADAGNTPALEVFADSFGIWDNTDETKRLTFTLSGESTGITTNLAFSSTANRTLTFPDVTDTLVGKTTTDTLTNKTLTSPKINENVVLTSTATELNILDGATLTTTELNYVDGVTSDIQTQLNAKADLSGATFTGVATSPNFISGFRTQATAAGTTTLVVGDASIQQFTGATTQTVLLPTTGVVAGQSFKIINNSTGIVTVQSSGANTILTMTGVTSSRVTSAVFTALVATPTTAAHWSCQMTVPYGAATTTILVGGGITASPTWTTVTGSGTPVFGTSPTFTTSVIGGATMAVFNTTSTTVTAFGAATTLTVGGTPTTAITHNYSTNATATATTKAVNLGTGGAAGSTTNINIGSSVAGTTTVNSPNISLGSTTGVTTTGSINLGHASDTTIARSGAGAITVEGVQVLLSGAALGTPSSGVATNLTGTATGLTSGITNALKSATTTVDVSASAEPTIGQVLTATSGTTATWQTPSAGAGDMVLASVQTVTGLKTFDKDKIAMKGTSTGTTVISTAQTDASSYTQTLQARTGTIANQDDVTFIGTTSVALNRTSAALTLAGITLTTPDIGTPSAGVMTNVTGTAAGLTAGNATQTSALKSATTTVNVDSATAPSSGQVLTATSSTAATWQTPAAGSGASVTLTASEDLTAGDVVGISNIKGGIAKAYYTAKTVAHSGTSITGTPSMNSQCAIGGNKFVSLNFGTGGTGTLFAQVGEYSASTNAITLGTIASVTATYSGTADLLTATVCKLGTDKFIVFYVNDASATVILYRVGTVSGTTITLGAEATFTTAASTVATSQAFSADYISADKGVFVYKAATTTSSSAIAFTVSSTTATAGTPIALTANTDNNTISKVKRIGTDKFVVIEFNNSAHYGVVGTCSGGTTITLGTEALISNTAQSVDRFSCDVTSPADDVFAIRFPSNLAAATVSTRTITAGSTLTITFGSTGILWSKDSSTIVAMSYGICVQATLSGSTLSDGKIVANRISTNSANQAGVVLDSNVPIQFSYDATNMLYWSYGMANNFIGVVQSTVTAGNTASVVTRGIDANQTGLSAGQMYLVTGGQFKANPVADNVTSSTADDNNIVKAISATQILI